MNQETKQAIMSLILDTVTRTIKRMKKERTLRPFHEALLTKGLIVGSAFERSFSTSFGQKTVETMAYLLATLIHGQALKPCRTTGQIFNGQYRLINQICDELRNKDSARKPNWHTELAEVQNARSGNMVDVAVISDIWVLKGRINCFYSLKTVKPNIDQTEKAKKDMLTLKALDPSCEVYFGLPYNPYGNNQTDYNWNQAFTIFDMRNDPCVLIGRDLWDNVGEPGVYAELISIFESAGAITRAKLAKEF